ncbi:MAG: patatin-like phospholipase family protein [Bacteroidota bacterium]
MLRLVSLILGFFLCFQAYAQKVGLVLSGGGAKGLAHVGVIKALEENNIPIDYLAGTSMGGIIAGCYAAGYSAAEIEEIVLSEDFNRWVNGKFEKGFNYYYSQEEPSSSILSIHLSLDSVFNAAVTSSIASDLSLNFALAEKFAVPSAQAGYNFDSLLVPTRIIAAEIFTQHEEIIKEGSLGNALRATLSVPFFYKPIRFNGKYLFDGGIYNNFPVDIVAEEFSPDVIIGSNVSSKIYHEYPRDEDDQLLNSSLLFMILDKSDPEQIPESGVYLEPSLEGYTAFDFNEAQAMIDSGYSATISQIQEIRSKIKRRSNPDELQIKRENLSAGLKPDRFSGIDFHGFNSKQRKYIRHIFRQKNESELSFDQIKKGYFRLMSEGYFEPIYPDIITDPNGDAYRLQIYGRPENNFNIGVGGAIASRNISQIFLGLEHYYFDNYLLKNSMSFYSGSFYKSAQLRTRLNLPALGQFFLETDLTYNRWDYVSSDDILKLENSPTILDRTDRKYGLNIGFPLGSKFRAVLNGAWVDNFDEFSDNGNINPSDTLNRLELDGFRFGFTFDRNNLNRKQYANEGKSFRLSADYFNLREVYEPGSVTGGPGVSQDRSWLRIRADIEQYFRYGRFSTGYYLSGVLSNQPSFSNDRATLISSPTIAPLQDSKTLFLDNFRGHNFVSLGLRNVVSIRRNLEFRLEGYGFKRFDTLDSDSETPNTFGKKDEIYIAATAGLVLQSPVGPVSLSLNYYDDDETELGILLHAGFLLFNRKSLD